MALGGRNRIGASGVASYDVIECPGTSANQNSLRNGSKVQAAHRAVPQQRRRILEHFFSPLLCFCATPHDFKRFRAMRCMKATIVRQLLHCTTCKIYQGR